MEMVMTPKTESALNAVAEARDGVHRAERERDKLILVAVDEGQASLRAVAQVAGLTHETVRKIVRELRDNAA